MSKLNIPNYEIIEEIAEGGMATVYLARQINLDREVALKVMSPTFASDKVLRDNFLQEGQIIARLSHPHIITIHDIGIANDHYYMAMEYMPGDTLKERIQTGLTPQESQNIIKQLAKALGYAHYHDFIHRDIKPGNVLFRGNSTAILTDFGVAKTKAKTSDLTRMGYMVGTPHYMSPEQATGESIDHRSDLYSLGVLFYEMLTKDRPYTADNTMAIAYKHVNDPLPALPIELKHFQRVLDKLLAKHKEDRYENAREFISALEQTDDTATRIMPSLVKRRSPANQQEKAQVTQVISSTYQPIKQYFNNLITQLKEWWFVVIKKSPQNDAQTTGVEMLKEPTSSDAIASKLEQMQARQIQLEKQLAEQKSNTSKLEQQLISERENRSAVSDKTLVRMQELDEQVREETRRAKELEVILKGSADEISQLNQHVEIEQAAFTDNTKPEHYVLESDGSLATDDFEDELNAAVITMELPAGETQPPDTNEIEVDDTVELARPPEAIDQSIEPGIHILTPATNKLVDGNVIVDSTSTSCLLSGQVTTADEIKSLSINGHPTSVGISGFFCVKYHLVNNETSKIHIVATDINDNVVENELRMKLINSQADKESNDEASDNAPAPVTHALIIGNTDYHQFPSISCAANNANELAKVLEQKYKFTVHKMLNVTAVEILRELNKIHNEFHAKDNLLIYFSGHGIITSSGTDGYWLGVEATRGQPSSWLPNQAITTVTSLFNAQQMIILADACFTEVEPVKRNLVDLIKPIINKNQVRAIPTQACRTVLSSGWRQPIVSNNDPEASLFSSSLLEILRESTGFITSDDLHRELERRVSRHQLNNLGIRPVYGRMSESKHNEGEFIFRPS